MTLEEEHKLLLRIQADRQEFGALFDGYYKPIFGYLYRRTGLYDVAKDMAAETFLKAFLSIDRFTWKNISLSSWLYRIATNEANLFFRKRKYKPVNLERILDDRLLPSYDIENERNALEAELAQLEEFNLVRQKLGLLAIRYQEVISLRYFENRDNREISLILGKPEGTVKSLLSRGLEKLRQLVVS
jgi:RNA polymerase sigma-70 factor (ECF subfamily)